MGFNDIATIAGPIVGVVTLLVTIVIAIAAHNLDRRSRDEKRVADELEQKRNEEDGWRAHYNDVRNLAGDLNSAYTTWAQSPADSRGDIAPVVEHIRLLIIPVRRAGGDTERMELFSRLIEGHSWWLWDLHSRESWLEHFENEDESEWFESMLNSLLDVTKDSVIYDDDEDYVDESGADASDLLDRSFWVRATVPLIDYDVIRGLRPGPSAQHLRSALKRWSPSAVEPEKRKKFDALIEYKVIAENSLARSILRSNRLGSNQVSRARIFQIALVSIMDQLHGAVQSESLKERERINRELRQLNAAGPVQSIQ